tara:strand:+ start:57 stop:590 length:534 start_codon:yes stop_codon:yes gene_type:complete
MAESEIDNQAKKNANKKIKSGWKKIDIKKHNIKAAMKAERASNPEENHPILGGLFNKRSDKIKKLVKTYKKVNKVDKFLDKQSDRLDKHGIWNKNKGSALAYLEKQKLLKKGLYRDKKGGTILDTPGGAKLKFKKPVDRSQDSMARHSAKIGGRAGLKGGGMSTRGLGRAFMKGGKV